MTSDGTDLPEAAAYDVPRLGPAHTPEESRALPAMTVMANLLTGPAARRGDADASLETVFELFPVLDERRQQVAQTLSGGEQQMLAIGRGLMLDPALLMMDEPSLGLAPSIVDDVFDMIDELQTRDITILLVEQNAARALSIADYGYVLESGSLVMEGTSEELLDEQAVKRAYFGQ
jgi:branched-chain amino acid transport system ATP-binding protein